MKFDVYCNIILQVFVNLEPSMTNNHKKKFRMVLEDYMNAQSKVIKLRKEQGVNFEEFIRIRCDSTGFKLWELFEEICRGVDSSQFAENRFFK